MDKRFFLFLILTALVLLVTPRLFPPPQRSQATGPVGDSGRAVARQPAETAKARPEPVAPPAPRATDTLPVTGPADTVMVRLAKATYRISTIGAAPVGVVLHDYKALSREDGQVQLVRPGVPLVSYALLRGPGDTLRLDRVRFSADSSGLAQGRRPSLTLQADVGGEQIALTYTFSPDSYLVRVRAHVEPVGANSPYLLVTFPSGLRSQEADTLDDQRHLAYVVKPVRDDVRSIPFGKLDSPEPREEVGPLRWVASKNKYFVLIALTDTTQVPFRGVVLRGLPRIGKTVTSATATALLPAGKDGQFTFDLYAGPQEWRRLVALGRDVEHVNPYGGFFRGIVQPFATIVMRILLWMHDQIRIGYGWVLIIFGVAVRIILWPLNQSAMRASLRMQRLQPELQAIQRKYADNREKQQQEMIRLYREHGLSPLSPLMGCLPMLIPMPVLFALFFVFQNTIEFRGVSFLWLPDISLKDPYYILPIVMGISMYLLSWIGMRGSPPNPQAKMMGYVFPVVMTVFFLNLPSGLNLYYAVQNIAALPQQWLIARERAKAGPPAAPPAPVRAARASRRSG